MPRTTRPTNRSQPTRPFTGASSTTRTGYASSVVAGTSTSAGSRKVASRPVAWPYSRAMPRTLKQ